MTREELLADIDEATQAFAEQIASQDEETTGVPKPPKIEVTESQLDPVRIGFDLDHDPSSETDTPTSDGIITITPPDTGACCRPGGAGCSVESPAECAHDGGTYMGTGSHCVPDPCPSEEPIGACCNDESCSIHTLGDCTDGGGYYLGDFSVCDPNPCADVTGGCCDPATGACIIVANGVECAGIGGVFRGPGSDCAPDPLTGRTCSSCFTEVTDFPRPCPGCLITCGPHDPFHYDEINCIDGLSQYQCCLMNGHCTETGCLECAVHADPFDGSCWYMNGKLAACLNWGPSLAPGCIPCCLPTRDCG